MAFSIDRQSDFGAGMLISFIYRDKNRCLIVSKSDANHVEGVDPVNRGYRKFLRGKMSPLVFLYGKVENFSEDV